MEPSEILKQHKTYHALAEAIYQRDQRIAALENELAEALVPMPEDEAAAIAAAAVVEADRDDREALEWWRHEANRTRSQWAMALSHHPDLCIDCGRALRRIAMEKGSR